MLKFVFQLSPFLSVATEKVVQLPTQPAKVTVTAKAKEIVPTFTAPLQPEVRAKENSVAR